MFLFLKVKHFEFYLDIYMRFKTYFIHLKNHQRMKTLLLTPSISKLDKRRLGDFYWAYADILRGIGIPAATYDQRIMAFMVLKLLVDNDKLMFNFDYKHQFGLNDVVYKVYKKEDTKATFLNLIEHLEDLGLEKNLKYFKQAAQYNPGDNENILAYVNHPRIFNLTAYVEELTNEYLKMVLDIYTNLAHFVNYPKEKYINLYEETISRMKKLTGDLTGQHFTQKSIIHLMCRMALKQIKSSKKIAIYDPACGTGSMVMEAAYYFKKEAKKKQVEIEVFGQEIHAQTWLLCKIFLEICSLDGKTQGINNIIACGNTLIEPAFAEGINGEDSFDFIIANPPFGMDWKHSYKEIVKNMISEKSHFFEVLDKGKPVTPRKNDGQFLFMMHILKLMEQEAAKGKRAIAAVISSSTLVSTGTQTSAEAKIRRAIFSKKLVRAIIEQPNAMFTNTDISSHIWLLDTEESEQIRIIKADTEVEPIFSLHPDGKDKMKHAYSKDNIKRILKLLKRKTAEKYVTANINPIDCHEINLATEIGRPDPLEHADLGALETEIDSLLGQLCTMKFSL